MTSDPLDSLFTTPDMAAVFAPSTRLQAMLDVEAALARAEAAAGVIPAEAVKPIATACDAALFDLAALGRAGRQAGNLAIPMVAALTARVADAAPKAAAWVHWGATSQDIIDSGLMLQLRVALALLEADMARLDRSLAKLARRHAKSVMVGRTWLQQAVPVSFGLKAAGWLSALRRDRQRLHEFKPRLLVLQFGGAAGTLASLGTKGPAVAARLARELHLGLPELPWHSQRDRVVELAAWGGLLSGNLGKMARDISLLMQSEVAEVFEPAGAGKGGSSAMPQKRNPVACAAVLANAARVPGLLATLFAAMPQEHERGLGGWQAEWRVLPELLGLVAGSLSAMAETIEGLEVDPKRMRRNLDASNGLVLAEAASIALGQAIGKAAAHKLVSDASRRAVVESRPLPDILAAMPEAAVHLDRAALKRVFDPLRYLGASDKFIAAALRQKVKGR